MTPGGRVRLWEGRGICWSACSLSRMSLPLPPLLFCGSGGLSHPDVDPQALGSLHHSPSPLVEGEMLPFAFQNLYLPRLPLIRANYTWAPNCRLPGCHGTFIRFGVGRNCSLKCHI